jgi:hypothetical protein
MKKYKLKKWCKYTLTILSIILFTILMIIARNRFIKIANKCDEIKGYTCSLYEINQIRK